MKAWIALLRGINVGKGNRIAMATLRESLESVGMSNVRTYIQSGNIVFHSSLRSDRTLGKTIADAVERLHGFRPGVMVLSATELWTAMEQNPYPEAISQPKTLHFFFLADEPRSMNEAGMAELATANERFQLIERVYYLYTPDGLGASKLAARAEKLLGVPATARNLNTVKAVWEMTQTQES